MKSCVVAALVWHKLHGRINSKINRLSVEHD
jgi:hypothetical protein